MSLTKVRFDQGAIELKDGQDTYAVAKGTKIVDSDDVKARVRASTGKDFPYELLFYKDSDGNEYLIVGTPPSKLPDPVQERRDAGERA